MNELRFLVIEDDLFYQTYVNDLLADTGADIVNASDGEAGFSMALSEKPDLIITDIEIPKIQGFILLKKLRENPDTSDIPVIMMSGKVEKGLLERHSKLSTHADGYLMKPFSGTDLLELVGNVLRKGRSAGDSTPGGPADQETAGEPAGPLDEEPAHPSRELTKESLSVLIVDDSRYILDIAGDFLDEIGAQVLKAGDGESGLSLALETRPDIVLLDVQMPGINGFVVCEKLKKNPTTGHIPVILMSAVVDDESFQRHAKLKHHADAYLQKPFMKSELQDLVKSFISSKTHGAEAVQDKTGFFLPSEEESAVSGPSPARAQDEALRRKLAGELQAARMELEAAGEREKAMDAEMEGIRRERDGFEEQLYNLKGSADSREKDLQDKLTVATHRYEESRQAVERLEAEKRELASRLEEKDADREAADKIEELEKRLASAVNDLDLSRAENEQLKGMIADTAEVDALHDRIRDLQDRLEGAERNTAELESENERLRNEAKNRRGDEETAGRLHEMEAAAAISEEKRRELERDLTAAVAAKNEIEEQVRTLLADTKGARREGQDREVESLRQENQRLTSRVAEAETRTKWLAEVEKQLESVQGEADRLRQELESVSTDRDDADEEGIREELEAALERAGDLEDENARLTRSLKTLEEVADQRDRLSEKIKSLEKELEEEKEARAMEAGSGEAAEERLKSLLGEKALLEADLEEARKLLDMADERAESAGRLARELEEEKERAARIEKQLEEMPSSVAGDEESEGRIRELEKAGEELAEQLRSVRSERDGLELEVSELEARVREREEAAASPAAEGRLEQLEGVLRQTILEAQSVLKEQKDRELALEENVESLVRSLDEERAFFRQDRERWREREEDLKEAFEDALKESRRLMGEEAARLYPMHIPRISRPLEVVTGGRKYVVAAGLALAAAAVFFAGHFFLSGLDRPTGGKVVPSGQEPAPVVSPAPEKSPVAPAPPPMPYLNVTGPEDDYESLWRRNTIQSVSEDMMLQATFHTRTELEAAIKYTASKESWTSERTAMTMGDLERTYDLQEFYYVTVFSRNMKSGYPGYADSFEKHIALRDGAGREVKALLPEELERSKFITSRVSAAGKEMNPVFLYEVGLTVAFPKGDLEPGSGGLQLVLYDMGAIPVRVLTWDMDAINSR